ncbi:6055_t:CDS:1, partial [Acaulospora colombiana]
MGKLKKGLTLAVDRDTDDPLRRPRPASQEGYNYPEEHNNYVGSPHLNSKRQPMRQYGSSGSLEVRHEYNRQRREQEFFSSSQSSPPDHPSPEILQSPPGSPYDISDYYRNTIIQPDDAQLSRSPPYSTQQLGGSMRSVPKSNPQPTSSLSPHGYNSSLSSDSENGPSKSNPLTPQTPYSANSLHSPSPMRSPIPLPRSPGPVQQLSHSTSQRAVQHPTQVPRTVQRSPQNPIPVNAMPQRPIPVNAMSQRSPKNPVPVNVMPQRPPLQYHPDQRLPAQNMNNSSIQRSPTQYSNGPPNQRSPVPHLPLQRPPPNNALSQRPQMPHSNNALPHQRPPYSNGSPLQRPLVQYPDDTSFQRPPMQHSRNVLPQRPLEQHSGSASPQRSPIPHS